MGCVFVRGIAIGQGRSILADQSGVEVLLASINPSLFDDKLSSDIHAEANA